MKKWHMVVDLAKCVGCFNCMLACKDEHVGNKWLPFTDEQQKHDEKWINPYKQEKGQAPFTEVCYVTKMCQHCDNAPCAQKCPEAVLKRSDGIVLLDVQKAKGNKALVDACPYGMITWNEELETAQKCTMCVHLLSQGWQDPRCVQACPLRALSVVYCEDNEFEKMAEQQYLKPITDGSNKPRVLYKNLHKYTKCYIAGALAYMDGDSANNSTANNSREAAATGAHIKLKMNQEVLLETDADFLGEFKFDKLPKNSGTFLLECTMDGFMPIQKEVVLGESTYVGVFTFEKR